MTIFLKKINILFNPAVTEVKLLSVSSQLPIFIIDRILTNVGPLIDFCKVQSILKNFGYQEIQGHIFLFRMKLKNYIRFLSFE